MQWPKQRAWGWYATLIRTPWFCLKVLRFKPGGQLSMQRHQHRTEIWFFLNAFGYIFGDIFYILNNSFSIWIIKPNQWHQFVAMQYFPVYAIELQYGRKVTESDIERR